MSYLRVCANPECRAEKYVSSIVRDGQLCQKCSHAKFRPLNNGVALTHTCTKCGKNPEKANFTVQTHTGLPNRKCNICISEPVKGKKILTKKDKEEISNGFKEYFKRIKR